MAAMVCWSARPRPLLGQKILVGMADVLSKVATNSMLTGRDFGKSLMEYLPETVGSTVGNAVRFA